MCPLLILIIKMTIGGVSSLPLRHKEIMIPTYLDIKVDME